MKAVTRLLREPLLHFLLLGAALFGVWSWRKDTGESEAGRIVVTRAKVSQLASGFARTRQRPPTPRETEALVRDFVREEVCVREARKMGLDRDDTIVRQRLREKFEFLTEDTLEATDPGDEAHRKERREAFIRSLLARYDVVIEPAGDGRPAAEGGRVP